MLETGAGDARVGQAAWLMLGSSDLSHGRFSWRGRKVLGIGWQMHYDGSILLEVPGNRQ